MDILEKKIKLSDIDTLALFGYNDTHLKLIENKFHSSINVRGDVLTVRGEPSEVKIIEKVFDELRYILIKKGTLRSEDVMEVLGLVRDALPSANRNGGAVASTTGIVLQGKKDGIRIKNPHQQEYVDKVAKNDVVFAIGPAGTGKTFLAVAMALAALRNNEVSRILLSRPAVEAGESLGFLPGDLNEKVVPYLRPLLDALGDMLTPEKLKSMSEKEIIEIVPLAYMRGRTLNNSFIILDEAQNATITQMKMFLTRLGRSSKAIITGDITQIDLPNKHDSGLVDVQRILHGIDGIDFLYFDKADVVRHRLVADIIDAYEKDSM